jgi:hypothetical protein
VKTLELTLGDELAARLEEAARKQGISLEELLRTSAAEKLDRDAAFEAAADYVVEKNETLYERLS